MSARGVGLVEAPRGALAHYIVIEDGLIRNYQAVVPTTWNASPRDADGQGGPMEMSLLDHRILDQDHPVELLRAVHTSSLWTLGLPNRITRIGQDLMSDAASLIK